MRQVLGRKPRIAAVALCALSLLGAGSTSNNSAPYPEGFRRWTHVKSAVNEPTHPKFGKFSGIYHIYANEAALSGFRSGRFRDGSILVFDLMKTQTKDHVTQAVGRHFVDVMIKDSKAYRETGGWGYEEFQGGNRTARNINMKDVQTRCHSCHTTQQARDYVFSSIAD